MINHCTIPTLYLEGDPVVTATWAYWLIGLLYPTTEVGLRRTRGELLEYKRKQNIIRISSSWSCNVWNNVVLSHTFLKGEEVRLSTGLPRYQSWDDLWSYSFPLEEWSSQWSDFWGKCDKIETIQRGALSFCSLFQDKTVKIGGTYLNFISLVSSFIVCSSSCLIVTCSLMISPISDLTNCSLL